MFLHPTFYVLLTAVAISIGVRASIVWIKMSCVELLMILLSKDIQTKRSIPLQIAPIANNMLNPFNFYKVAFLLLNAYLSATMRTTTQPWRRVINGISNKYEYADANCPYEIYHCFIHTFTLNNLKPEARYLNHHVID
ncbi:hypothetical protein CGI29_18480 [Vibrio parahaemolyticus]|nr:hypothetical protein CGI41_07335 [Vibrio parahaemolyticus]TOJ82481.1 hypothetical protein CGI31_10415 [Vibrio parahaemolyticus]TOJ93474.1 hypothetical protein CGI29_18480 [Vibrio parahaemolyticus]